MSDFPEMEQAFRQRFGFEPEIPFPPNLEAWADVLRDCVQADSTRPYWEAIEYERKIAEASA